MIASKRASRYGRNIYLLKRVKAIAAIAVIALAVLTSIFILVSVNSKKANEKRELLRVWNLGEYEAAYLISREALAANPIDYFFLTMNGFSAYQMGVAQINNQNTLGYIDESIFSLRKAMLHNNAQTDARIFYVLGKAYAYKGYEYSDLAVKYLTIADNMAYNASDIPEYLGLAYASAGDYRSSIEAFSLAFKQNESPSDNLMLSIARSYISLEEYNTAQTYLARCVESSPDSKAVITARFLLGEIYNKTGDYERAEEQFLAIIEENGENAEARFQLGEIYFNIYNKIAEARDHWRIALRTDPAHAKARARLYG